MSNPFEDPAWLRGVLEMLITQLGGRVVIELSQTRHLASLPDDTDVGVMTYEAQVVDGRSVIIMTAQLLPPFAGTAPSPERLN